MLPACGTPTKDIYGCSISCLCQMRSEIQIIKPRQKCRPVLATIAPDL